MSIDVLQEKIRRLRCPVMAELSPSWNRLPQALQADCLQTHGETLLAAAEAYRQHCTLVLQALEGAVPAVSVCSGSFLALGADGAAALQAVLREAAARGFYVLLEQMRSDLGACAQAQADAAFGALSIGGASFTPYPCDGVLLDAYLGSDSAAPYTAYCKTGKNVFLVARSANRSARELQDLLSGDRIVHQVTADLAMRWSAGLFSRAGYSEIGVAVGATCPDILQAMRRRYDQLFFLVPGYAMPGGGAQNAARAFGAAGYGACVIDDSIQYAAQDAGTDDAAAAIRQAAMRTRESLLAYVTVY